MSLIQRFEAEILDIKDLTPTVKYFKLSVPKTFTFKSGQFVGVYFLLGNEKKINRPYSIASQPNKKGFIELCIKRVNSGVGSNILHSLKNRDKLSIQGPLGGFTIRESSFKKDIIFIASGTGISTFKSMIPDILESGFKNKILLLKGFRDENEILYEKEFTILKKKYKNLKFYNILSQPIRGIPAYNIGYVQDFLDKYIPNDFNGDFYLCGLSGMINNVKDSLLKKGFNENQIFFERYD
ncbi:hypothetical protein J4225_05255 [Candidatus Pacearchaeota archaeon]|nr:hypothetical protein [Candidatus Pacearchaeota archaeon]